MRVAQPTTQLNATEQDTLVKQIGLALLRAAPRDWRKVKYAGYGRPAALGWGRSRAE